MRVRIDVGRAFVETELTVDELVAVGEVVTALAGSEHLTDQQREVCRAIARLFADAGAAGEQPERSSCASCGQDDYPDTEEP